MSGATDDSKRGLVSTPWMDVKRCGAARVQTHDGATSIESTASVMAVSDCDKDTDEDTDGR